MWKTSDVELGKNYRLWLCQSRDRRRYFALVQSDDSQKPQDGIFQTTEISPSLLIEGNLDKIAEAASLEGGGRFMVEAHGVWLTEAETEALEDDLSPVPWTTSHPPVFPPR